MKYRVEALETAAAEGQDWRFMIHTALGWAYLNSLEAGNELPDFNSLIWEKDVEEILAGMRHFGIREFTISSPYSNLPKTLAAFEKHGAKVDGMTEVKGVHKDLITDEHEILPAIKLSL